MKRRNSPTCGVATRPAKRPRPQRARRSPETKTTSSVPLPASGRETMDSLTAGNRSRVTAILAARSKSTLTIDAQCRSAKDGEDYGVLPDVERRSRTRHLSPPNPPREFPSGSHVSETPPGSLCESPGSKIWPEVAESPLAPVVQVPGTSTPCGSEPTPTSLVKSVHASEPDRVRPLRLTGLPWPLTHASVVDECHIDGEDHFRFCVMLSSSASEARNHKILCQALRRWSSGK